MRSSAIAGFGVALVAVAGASVAALAIADGPKERPRPPQRFVAANCPSGFSSGMQVDYVEGGGEQTAALATAKITDLVRQHEGRRLVPRTVRADRRKVVTQFVDDTGQPLAQGSVVRVGAKWQIESLQQCASSGPPSPPAPAGWRAETYRDVQVSVPSSWQYAATGVPWCVRRHGTKAGPPYVGRPGAVSDVGCSVTGRPRTDPAYRAQPGGTFVTFAPASPAARDTLSEPVRVGDRNTFVLAGVQVVVQAPARLRERIMSTIRQVSSDPRGCPTALAFGTEPDWRPPAGPTVSRLTGVTTATACRYDVATGTGRLTSSVQLRGAAARSAVTAIAAAPLRGGPDDPDSCSPTTTFQGDVLNIMIRSRQGLTRVIIRYDGSSGRRTSTASTPGAPVATTTASTTEPT
jgi:hypothetical protein